MVCGMNPLYKTENNVVHSSSPSPQNYKNAVKPPIAIKPIFNAILHSDLGHLNNTQSSLRQKLPPMPPPRSRKRTVPPGDYERQFSMADFKGLERELELARYENKEEQSQNLPKSGVSGHVVNLPTLTKCTKNHIFLPKSEFIHSTTQPYINRIPNKFQSPRDKNALLIEKVRGSSAPCFGYQPDLSFTSYQQNKQLETLPLHQESNLSASLRSSLSPPCTTNSTLIISVNNSNNNVNKNNNMLREDYNLKPIVKDSIVDISTEPNIRLSDILLLPFSETANPPSSILKASTLTTTAISTPIVITSSVTNSGSYRVHSTCPATTTASKMCSCSNSTCLEHNEEQVLKKKDFKTSLQSSSFSPAFISTSSQMKETIAAISDTNIDYQLLETGMSQCINGDDEVDKSVASPYVTDSISSVVPRSISTLVADPLASMSAPCSPAKPLLRKIEAVDLEEYDYYKKLSRGISKATDNENIVSKARSEFAKEIWEAIDPSGTPFFVETPKFTFTLPDLSIYSDEFRAFLEKDLIETRTLVSLEGAGRLNWWALIGASQRLWPLATTGDGNCLLHAASLGMWGFHDRLLTLRKALHEFMTRSQYARPLWRRWRWQLTQTNKQTGLQYSAEEWESEWANVLRLASSIPRGNKTEASENRSTTNIVDSRVKRLSNSFISVPESTECSGHVYESLEEIHILALAHILRRPIIVVADTTLKDVSGEPLAPIPFGGVYLPLECPPHECQSSPLLLTYDAAHFSALVVMDTHQEQHSNTQIPAIIPLTDYYHDILLIQFVIDPGEDFLWGKDDNNPLLIQKFTMTNQDKIGLLNDYLIVTQVPIPLGYLEAVALSQEEAECLENCYQVEMEKKTSEYSFNCDDGMLPYDGVGIFNSKIRATKQLQTVAKQFGSIGKSMSKRIKKNFDNLSKMGRSGSFKKKDEYTKMCSIGKEGKLLKVSTHQNFILAAEIQTEKRHAYQEEMISNYLSTARLRFDKDKEIRRQKEIELKQLEKDHLEHQDETEGPIECINSGCNMYGTALTSYMCSSCFAKQKEEEQDYNRDNAATANASSLLTYTMPRDQSQGSPVNTLKKINENDHSMQHFHKGLDGPQYGAGKSKFYAELDDDSLINATKIPTTNALSSKSDGTLFLSNSTFYSDASNIPSYNMTMEQATTSQCGVTVHLKDSCKTGKEDGISNSNGCDQQKQNSNQSLCTACDFYGKLKTGGYCSHCNQENENSSINSKG